MGIVSANNSFEEGMNALFGGAVNKHFANHLVEIFQPTISHVVAEMVIAGKNKTAVNEAARVTAEALVVGMRAVLSNASLTPESDQPQPVTLTVTSPEGLQTPR
ncbi:hypothetical protein ACNSO8_18000 [Yersinia sp. LJYL362]|uniref:hypothetical protein n=1 Tax=Yersinia sp. LJYL362 TaxID=3402108 RepID=UPI003AB62B74